MPSLPRSARKNKGRRRGATTTTTADVAAPSPDAEPRVEIVHVAADGTTANDDGGYEIDAAAKQWLTSVVDREIVRLRSLGAKASTLPLANVAIVVDDTDPAKLTAINRIEVAANHDFDAVTQILLAEPIAYPLKPDHAYVHVVLLNAHGDDPSAALVLPYLYDTKLTVDGQPVANDLQQWLFVNSRGKRTRHAIDNFEHV
ncbi:hypothetical protein AMAG_07440 [Allomyces macrogynus ATCC 38327]|uniref:Uncharacterized protein n=1 Tax=Allomyces macrogynus (strain ATCC 38327) TaxID=578462 RepID=A0A0L0SIA0_ALLM3|nr:hypothetical protein AMAG_07440 [Allomyces macrogynus ATCC 38327]|eukprot:KNE62197.1 hypothetical protein AMAG_07440 [Allomyces macrogynus ATCC 38327]